MLGIVDTGFLGLSSSGLLRKKFIVRVIAGCYPDVAVDFPPLGVFGLLGDKVANAVFSPPQGLPSV